VKSRRLRRALAGLGIAALGWPLPAASQAAFNIGGETAQLQVTSLRDLPFQTVIRQRYDYSCGSAALATLLTYHYGRPTTEAQVFTAMYRAGDQAKIRRVGFSLLDMKRLLDARGLRADGYRWTLEDLRRSNLPAIALIRVGAYRHFVIIKGARGGQVLVGDPAQGLKSYSEAAFVAVWDGVVFTIAPDVAGHGAYDRTEEWARLHSPEIRALGDSTLAGLTRELPPIFQIVALPQGGAAIR